MAKEPYVFGTRPSHEHEVDGKKIVCNSPYCDHMDALPKDQENQRPPWANVKGV
jgi:hypothetical protein